MELDPRALGGVASSFMIYLPLTLKRESVRKQNMYIYIYNYIYICNTLDIGRFFLIQC